MSLGTPRVLALSLLTGLGIAVVAGGSWAVLGDADFMYATGAMLFVIGLIALAVGLLGASEPEEGWAIGRGAKRRQEGRRSLAARVSGEHPDLETGSSWSLAVWGVIVGGGLIGLSLGAFALAA